MRGPSRPASQTPRAPAGPRALVAGSRLCAKHLNDIMASIVRKDGDATFDPKANKKLRDAIKAARKSLIPENYIQRVIQFARQVLVTNQSPTLRAHGMLAVMSATIFIVGSLLYRRYAPRAVEYI